MKKVSLLLIGTLVFILSGCGGGSSSSDGDKGSSTTKESSSAKSSSGSKSSNATEKDVKGLKEFPPVPAVPEE